MEDFVPILSHTAKEEWEDVLQAKLSWCSLKRVRGASVMVVGCGALGNEVIKNLVLFGVRKIVVVDFDRVEEYNLSRSILFSKEDAIESLPKVQAIQKKVKEINPEVEIIPIVGDVYHAVGLGLLKRVDAVIGCVDSRWARFCINRLCMRAGIKWIDGGIEGLEGTARVFAPGENCYACNLTPEMFKDIKKRASCPSIIQRNERAERAATTPIIASIIAAVQVQEFLKIIHENKEKKNPFSTLCGNMFYYEGEHFTTKVVKLKGFDEGCPEHETWEDILTLPLSDEDKVGR
ncbi:MAG TPA: hypothetical protein DDY68_03585, partial [Porphyromonadaceae bacterium]|nr:hypothetical protein [Porphyromonadaceae bacterium]